MLVSNKAITIMISDLFSRFFFYLFQILIFDYKKGETLHFVPLPFIFHQAIKKLTFIFLYVEKNNLLIAFLILDFSFGAKIQTFGVVTKIVIFGVESVISKCDKVSWLIIKLSGKIGCCHWKTINFFQPQIIAWLLFQNSENCHYLTQEIEV